MIKISTIGFAQLRNAEHVSFLNNVSVAIEKVGVESLGIVPEQFTAYKKAVAEEQDIVNRSLSSVYTPEMKALDEERDRLFKLVRLKLQACVLADDLSDIAEHRTTIDKFLIAKYGLDVTTMAYQEESAVIRGFVLDVKSRFTEAVIKKLGISDDLNALEMINEQFTSMYNERVTEKSGTTTELTKKLRAASEELYGVLMLTVEYKCNTAPESEAGQACAGIVGVVNQLIKDVKHNLNLRLGKGAETETETETLQTSL